MEVSGSNKKIQRRQGAVKRKLNCCDLNAEWRTQIKTKCRIQCDYCQCLFYQTIKRDRHMKTHECLVCHEMPPNGNACWAHIVRHKQEAQLEQLKQKRQRQMDDDFVLCYVRANRLHQYRSQLHYEPDFDFIMLNYQFEKDEWLAFVYKFKRQFLDLLFGCFKAGSIYFIWFPYANLIKQVNAEVISYLLENGALSIHDAIDFLNILMTKAKYDDYVSVCLLHLLKKDCKIKSKWVARVINDDEMIERIKLKNTFTFDEIHKARKWDSYSEFDVNGLKTFYTQLQKHFFNPDFENPFDGLLDEDFNFKQEYERMGRLSFDRDSNEEEIAEMAMKSLADLIKEYIKEMKVYAKLDEKINGPKDKRDGRTDDSDESHTDDNDDDEYDGYDDYDDYDDYYDNYDEDEIEEVKYQLDEQGEVVSKLYFAISIK